jgi:hypothetical protein
MSPLRPARIEASRGAADGPPRAPSDLAEASRRGGAAPPVDKRARELALAPRRKVTLALVCRGQGRGEGRGLGEDSRAATRLANAGSHRMRGGGPPTMLRAARSLGSRGVPGARLRDRPDRRSNPEPCLVWFFERAFEPSPHLRRSSSIGRALSGRGPLVRLSTFGMALTSTTTIMSAAERRGVTVHAVRFSSADPSPRPSPRRTGAMVTFR